jgi:hypothetical protein
MPAEWIKLGIPPEALASFYEGHCPVHPVIALEAVIIRVGEKTQEGPEDIPAGWCQPCGALWSRPFGSSRGASGLAATWQP